MIIYTNAVEAHASSVWPVVFQHAGLFFSEGRTGTKLCLPPSLAVRELLNEIYDALTKLGLAYLYEGPRQCQTLCRREKVVRAISSLGAALGIRSSAPIHSVQGSRKFSVPRAS